MFKEINAVKLVRDKNLYNLLLYFNGAIFNREKWTEMLL
jgi:hypothetical protein